MLPFSKGEFSKLQKNGIRGLLLGGLLGGCAFLLAWFVPTFGLLFAAVAIGSAGGLFGYPGAVSGLAVLAAAGGIAAGAEWIPTAAFCAVAGVGGYLGMRRARRALTPLVNCCAAGLLGIWANVFAGGLLYGRQAIDAIYTAPQGMVDALGSAYSLMGYTASEVQAVQSEFILSYGEMVPAMFILVAMAIGLLVYALCSILMRRKATYSFPPFGLWRLPRGYMGGLLALYLVGALGVALEWKSFYSVISAAQMMIIFIYSVQGLSVVWFYLGRTKLPFALRLAVSVLVCGFAVAFAGSILVLVGIVEDFLMLRLRTLYRMGMPPGSSQNPRPGAGPYEPPRNPYGDGKKKDDDKK